MIGQFKLHFGGRFVASSFVRRLAGGIFWTTLSGLFGRVLSLVVGVVLARVFGTADYGAYGMIQGTVGMFGTLSGLGLGLTATKYVAEYRQSRPEDASQVVALTSSVALVSGVLFSIVLALGAGVLAVRVLGAPALEGPLRVSALLLFLSNVSGAQTGVLSGFESFRRLAYVSVEGGAVSAIALLAGGICFGVRGAVWGLVVGQFAICVFAHLAIVRVAREHGVRLRLWGSWGGSSHLLWRFSVPATLAGLMVTPVSWACSAMLVNTQGGLAQVGIFNAANQWFGLVIFIPGLLGQALIPMMSERLGRGDAGTSRRMLKMSTALNGITSVLIIAVVWEFGPLIARLYGRGFEATPAVLNIALITGGLLAVLASVGHVIVASGRMWMGFVMNLGWAICFIGATRLLVYRGALGLAEARLVAYVIHGVWTGLFAWRLLREGRAGTGNNVIPYLKPPGDLET
jgi:O-antigen/teichoic acid export membrane protein